MSNHGYCVRAQVEVRFKLGDMELTDAYITAAQLLQRMQPEAPGVGWAVDNIEISRGNGLPPNGSSTHPSVIAEKLRDRMAEMGLQSSRDVAKRTDTDPDGPVSHSTVAAMLRGSPTELRSRRRVAKGLRLPTNALD